MAIIDGTAWHSLPAEVFPFTVEYLAGATLLDTLVVPGPGAVDLPQHARTTHVRVTFATGEVITTPYTPRTGAC